MKDALLALGMGGPDTIEAIEPFLKNLLNDREIINFGVGTTLQAFIAGRISSSRSKKVAPHYQQMGGGSPQLKLTQQLLNKISPAYESKTGRPLDTYIGMCYWHPYIEDTVRKLTETDNRHPYRRIMVLPLYPQYSTTTTGACFNRLQKALSITPVNGTLCRISQFHTYEPYLNIIKNKVEEAARRMNMSARDCHLLFSAHSLPQSVVDKGDPYVRQLKEEIEILVKIISPASFSLSYQSKLGRMKWLSPSTEDELKNLAVKEIKNIIVVAVSFINDHIETLIELDKDLLATGRSLGLTIERAATPNDDDGFVDAMTQLLVNI